MRTKRLQLKARAERSYKTLPSSLAAQRERRSTVVNYLLECRSDQFTMIGDALSCSADGHSLNLSDGTTKGSFR